MNSKFHFHAKASGIPLCFVELWLHKSAYGSIDYYMLNKNGVISGYISDKGRKKAFNFGKEKLFDSDSREKILKKIEDHNKNLLAFGKLKEGEDRLEFFNKIKKICFEFGEIYFVMEEPWLAALESVIVDACNREGIAQQDVFSDISKAGFFKPGEKVLFDTVINLGRLKLKTHHNFEPVMLAFNKLAGYISKESGVPIEHVNGMTCADIEGYLSTGKLQREEIKKRYEACVFLASSDGGFPRIGSQSEFAAWDAILEPKITGDIRGLVACRGRARGRVSLHLDWTAITEIPEGNVLVTGMTNPQMVPYMKHVSAIITDEGGLTCHAAIISREMKIPCIVGTKVATRVLKDGDVVEVDAEKGIVRVIK